MTEAVDLVFGDDGAGDVKVIVEGPHGALLRGDAFLNVRRELHCLRGNDCYFRSGRFGEVIGVVTGEFCETFQRETLGLDGSVGTERTDGQLLLGHHVVVRIPKPLNGPGAGCESGSDLAFDEPAFVLLGAASEAVER